MALFSLQDILAARPWEPRRAMKAHKKAVKHARDRADAHLNTVFDAVIDAGETHLEHAFTDEVPLRCETLEFKDGDYVQGYSPCFFRPLPKCELDAYPLDLEDDDTKRRATGLTTDRGSEVTADRKSHSGRVCSNLDGLFRDCQRKLPDGKSDALRYLTGWLRGGLDGDGGFRSMTSWVSEMKIQSIYRRTSFGSPDMSALPNYSDVGNPHCMLVMKNTVRPKEDLLRGEVIAVLSAITVRLDDTCLEDHSVIPVMVFSFMKERKGRILQAHMDQEGLVIRKSPFYDFSTRETAEGNLDFFLRLLCGAPTGVCSPECGSGLPGK